MKAVVVSPPQPHSARLIEVPDPSPPEDGVLAHVVRVGIDGTDRELQAGSYGKLPEGRPVMTLGHEALARVAAAGPKSRFKPGDYIVPTVRRPGQCANCRAGESDFCSDGDYWERGIWRADGYMAEAFAEHDPYLLPIARNLLDVAVLLEPVSIAEKALRQVELIQRRMVWKQEAAWVFGAGPLGILLAFVLRVRDIPTLVYSREAPDSFEAQLIKACGAEYIESAAEPLDKLRRRPAPNAIYEATGAANLVLAVPALLARDGIGCLLGVSSPSGTAPVDEQAYNNGMVLGNRLVFGCVNSNRVDFEMGLTDMARLQQRWPGLLAKLFTRRLPLAQFADGLERQKSDIKVVLDVASE